MMATFQVLVVLAMCTLSCLAFEPSKDYNFAQYKLDFGRSYTAGSDEHIQREAVFSQSLDVVLKHNSDELRSWNMGINEQTDRTEGELSILRGYRRTPADPLQSSSLMHISDGGASCKSHSQSCLEVDSDCCEGSVCGSDGKCVSEEKAMPDEKDWSSLPTGRSIMNQGSCGSCWAVAATSVVGLHAAILTGNKFNKPLSPQRMLACTENPMQCGGEGGCKGATAELGMEYITNGGGLATADAEEYLANSDDKSMCSAPKASSFLQVQKATRTGNLVTLMGMKRVKENRADKLLSTLYHAGPVVASVVGRAMHPYKNGIFDNCDPRVIDHAVVMIGYGKEKASGKNYWKIRNSWGANWGEAGFIRVKRFAPDADEPCGDDLEPAKGIDCKDKDGKYPASRYVCGCAGILSDSVYPLAAQVPEALLS